MKKDKDIGLIHIEKLGIHAFRNGNALQNEFKKKFGKKANEMLNSILDASEDGNTSSFYYAKDQNYDAAMIMSGGYDANIIRKCCNWISDNKGLFGDTILEVGCDCGFMTTFLGSIFPEKTILAIDRCPAGLDIAKANVEKFGLSNVEFLCTDVTELSDSSFDTVFSMRTMQENSDISNAQDPALDLISQANVFANIKQPYADSLSQLVKDHGNIISIERLAIDALLLGWIQALDNTGLKIETDYYSQISAKEMDRDSFFQTLVYTKDTPCERTDSFNSFIKCCSKSMDMKKDAYNGWESQIMYAHTAGKLIEKIVVTDLRIDSTQTTEIRYHKRDFSHFLIYQHSETSGNGLAYRPFSELEGILDEFDQQIISFQGIDYISAEIIKP